MLFKYKVTHLKVGKKEKIQLICIILEYKIFESKKIINLNKIKKFKIYFKREKIKEIQEREKKRKIERKKQQIYETIFESEKVLDFKSHNEKCLKEQIERKN